MDFVLYILERFFNKSQDEAQRIMLEAHQKGVSIAGVYIYEIAETKVTQVLQAAKEARYPLRVTLETN
jgi:ATP-dependent Clp protease adaptor protein ClpS